MSINIFLQKIWSHKVFRFAIIGVVNTLTDLTLLNILVFAFGLRTIYANLISASISICISYFWNHYLVFRHQNKVSLKLFIKFFVITGFGILAIQSAVIYGLEHLISLNHVINILHTSHSTGKFVWVNSAKLLAVATSMVWNFFLYNFAVFKDDKKEEGVVPY